MKKCFVIILFLIILPSLAQAEERSNAELYQMIKKMEQKLDAAISETAVAKYEAKKAKEEAANARKELARIKKASATEPANTFVSKPSDNQALRGKPGIVASIETLYMQPSRSNLDFVIIDPDTDSLPKGSTKSVELGYDLGTRFNLTYTTDTSIDIGATLTKFKTRDSASAEKLTGGSLWGICLHPDSYVEDDDSTSATASYDLDYSVMDLGIGKSIDIDKNFSLHVNAGLRQASIKQIQNICYIDSGTSKSANIIDKNDFRGWGGRLGLDLDWRLGKGFSIFSSVNGSILKGDFDLSYSQIDNNSGSINTIVDITKNIDNQVIPVLELRAGIGYEYRLKTTWSVGIQAGYEWQNWFNMVYAQRFSDDVNEQLMHTDTTDIGLSGFFIKGFIKF